MATEETILFRGFPVKDRDDFLTIGHERQCRAMEPVIRDQAAGASLFIVLEGKGSVWRGDTLLDTIGEGDVFGESALFPFQNHARTPAVHAETAMRVLEFRRQEILNYFKWKEERLFKAFVLNILTILLGKLDRANERIAYLERRLHDQVMSAIGGSGT